MRHFHIITLILITLLLAACGTATQATPPAAALAPTFTPKPTITPGPTATPLPPESQALYNEYITAGIELSDLNRLLGREGLDKAQVERSIRQIVPTIEALDMQLTALDIPHPSQIVPPTPELVLQKESYTIGMVTADQVHIAGTYYNPGVANAPGVLLLHMVDGQRQDWDAFAKQLQDAGFAVLAIDLRGHGESEGQREWSEMGQDATIAVRLLRSKEEVDDSKIVVIGASIGANTALNYAASDPAIVGAALLSPGLEYRGVSIREAAETYGDRPLFIAASEEDRYAADSSQTISELIPQTELLLLQDQGHGTAMLGKENGLEEALIDWLQALFE